MFYNRFGWIMIFLSLALSACSERSDDKVAIKAANDNVAPVKSILDTLPEKDSKGLDLCAALPGSEVAAAIGATLISNQKEPLGTGCSYFVRTAANYKRRVDVAIKDRMTYDAVRQVAEGYKTPVHDLSGIGVAAYSKKSSGSDPGVWAVRADGLFVMARADDQASAEAVAKLALKKIP